MDRKDDAHYAPILLRELYHVPCHIPQTYPQGSKDSCFTFLSPKKINQVMIWAIRSVRVPQHDVGNCSRPLYLLIRPLAAKELQESLCRDVFWAILACQHRTKLFYSECLCVFRRMYIHTYMYVYVYMCICVHVYMCMCMCVCTHACMRLCMYVCLHVHVHTYIHVYE